MAELKVFQLTETQNNNHGCAGVSVTIFPWPGHSTRTGKVIDVGGGCSTCGADTRLDEGNIVQLPDYFKGSWTEAADVHPDFCRTDTSLAGSTRVRPDELVLKRRSILRK